MASLLRAIAIPIGVIPAFVGDLRDGAVVRPRRTAPKVDPDRSRRQQQQHTHTRSPRAWSALEEVGRLGRCGLLHACCKAQLSHTSALGGKRVGRRKILRLRAPPQALHVWRQRCCSHGMARVTRQLLGSAERGTGDEGRLSRALLAPKQRRGLARQRRSPPAAARVHGARSRGRKKQVRWRRFKGATETHTGVLGCTTPQPLARTTHKIAHL